MYAPPPWQPGVIRESLEGIHNRRRIRRESGALPITQRPEPCLPRSWGASAPPNALQKRRIRHNRGNSPCDDPIWVNGMETASCPDLAPVPAYRYAGKEVALDVVGTS
jgi:hypothetical protein